jgi:hypothetical protein
VSIALGYLPRLLFFGACLGTLAMLILTLEHRLRAKPPQSGLVTLSNPERTAANKLVPPPVADGQNFAATPLFLQLFDKPTGPASNSRWPDDFSRADQWPRRFPILAESPQGRLTGRFVTDLVAWKKAFEQSKELGHPSDREPEITALEWADPAANAAAAGAVLEALKPYEPVLAELQAVRARPEARFPVRYDWDNPWAILLPHLAVIKRTTQLLRLKASAEVAAGQAEPALQDVLLMLRLAQASKDEPVLISQLVRVACLEITMQPLWEGLAARRWSDSQLQTLQAALESFDFLNDLSRSLQAERTWGNLTITLLRDRRTPNLSGFLLGTEEQKEPEAWIQKADRAFENCPREWFEAEQRNFTQLYDELLLQGFDPVARRIYPQVSEENAHRLEKALSHRDTLLEKHLVFAKLLMVTPNKIHLKLAGAQGSADLARVACALERYQLRTGQYPQDLVALAPQFLSRLPHDLTSGQPLHYQRTGDGRFLLYSVGWNQTDEGGEPAFFASGRGPEKKEGDWVWRYPAQLATASRVNFE